MTVLDDFNDYYDPARKWENVNLIVEGPYADRYCLLEGDIRDASAVDRLFAEGRFDAVIHLAARAGGD